MRNMTRWFRQTITHYASAGYDEYGDPQFSAGVLIHARVLGEARLTVGMLGDTAGPQYILDSLSPIRIGDEVKLDTGERARIVASEARRDPNGQITHYRSRMTTRLGGE